MTTRLFFAVRIGADTLVLGQRLQRGFEQTRVKGEDVIGDDHRIAAEQGFITAHVAQMGVSGAGAGGQARPVRTDPVGRVSTSQLQQLAEGRRGFLWV